jgi:hypothetical protein
MKEVRPPVLERDGVGWDGMSAECCVAAGWWEAVKRERNDAPGALLAQVAADRVSGLASPEFTFALLSLPLVRILDLFLS